MATNLAIIEDKSFFSAQLLRCFAVVDPAEDSTEMVSGSDKEDGTQRSAAKELETMGSSASGLKPYT